MKYVVRSCQNVQVACERLPPHLGGAYCRSMTTQDSRDPDGARQREQRRQEIHMIIEHVLEQDAELLERLADS